MMQGGDVAAVEKDAKTALIMAVVGIFCFGLILGVLAVIKANAVLKTIDTTGVGIEKRGMANAARILGIVDIVLWAIAIGARIFAS